MAGNNPQTTLPPVPREPIASRDGNISSQWQRWLSQIQRILSYAGGISWDITNKAGSRLDQIETRTHAMLQSVLGWAAGADTDKVRHISNADGSVWQAHVEVIDGNPHGTDHAMLESIEVLNPASSDPTQDRHLSDAQGKHWQDHVDNDAQDDHSQYLLLAGRTGQRVVTPLILGTETDNIVFDSLGRVTANAGGRTYEDIQFNMTPKAVGAGHPTLATWNTDFEEWSYAVGEHSNGSCSEAPHWWAENTVVSFHVHFTTGSGNYVAGDKVQWQLKVTAADSKPTEPFTVFPAATVLTAETAFTQTAAPFSSVIAVFSAFSLPAEWTKIGAQIKVRIERIAKSAGGTDPGTNPFILQVGCHALWNSTGSREVGTK